MYTDLILQIVNILFILINEHYNKCYSLITYIAFRTQYTKNVLPILNNNFIRIPTYFIIVL